MLTISGMLEVKVNVMHFSEFRVNDLRMNVYCVSSLNYKSYEIYCIIYSLVSLHIERKVLACNLHALLQPPYRTPCTSAYPAEDVEP